MKQDETILRHLREVGSITVAEASIMYKVRCLTSNIKRLRDTYGDSAIRSEFKKDHTGQRYVRYHWEGES